MELSKIQKKLDPKVLEEGRQISKKIYYPTAIWFFAIGPFVFYLVSLTDFGENFYSSEGWHAFFIVFFLWGAPNIFCVYHLFTNPSAKYFKVISNTFKINIWFMRPFTKEEITFISKHFKEIEWKFNLGALKKNITGEDKFIEKREKALDKDYKYVEEFTELDDMQMKRLQTMYYIIIAVSGVIIYSFA